MEEEFEASGGEWLMKSFDEIFKPVRRGDVTNQLTLKESQEGLNFVAQNDTNNGFVKTVSNDEYKVFKGNSIIIGRQTGVAYYQANDFVTTDGVLVLEPLEFEFNRYSGLFFTTVLLKQLQKFSYTNTVSAQKLKELSLCLPYKMEGLKKVIDFSFIKKYIKALEAYLTVTNLRDYHLTKNDEKVLDKFAKLSDTKSRVEESEVFRLSPVTMLTLFPNIHQGRRLKKDDQINGDLPFVMAGTTNTGVVRNIGNDVRVFPKHSLTIDIFGNTFYRGYEFGAGDDTGVFWNDKMKDSKALLYLKTVIEKTLVGKYDFGSKLRASQTHNFQFDVPQINNQIDYRFMSDFIRAVEKLVIKDLVIWADKKIAATKEVVAR
ncbi:restriction endonuclease subunit S [uncultured Streptococcus sp.]|uniref:restriction endonuclease subunit S n=1 Tax=uncultured Streptococcus sp. TaxID=83427 RepID=UPI0025E1CA7B|nr:restriction endonuclease subunit S [uncultured Streptococcus sp.]